MVHCDQKFTSLQYWWSTAYNCGALLFFSSDSSSHSSPSDVETPGPPGLAGEKQGRWGLQVESLQGYPDRAPASTLGQVP